MEVWPSPATYRELAGRHAVVPVWAELLDDLDTPISLYAKLVGDGPGYLLESAEHRPETGRYSFVGADPFWRFTSRDGRTVVTRDGLAHTRVGPPLSVLRQEMAGLSGPGLADLPPFWGGAVGYCSYDLVRRLERLPGRPTGPADWPDVDLLAARLVAVHDHLFHRSFLVANVPVSGDPDAAYRAAQGVIARARQRLAAPGPRPLSPAGGPSAELSASLDEAAYVAAVERAQQYIRAGDIFQVVLSRRLTRPSAVDALSVYRTLRAINPSPYLFLLNHGDRQLVGSSPEMLVRVTGDRVQTRPIAGTRPRGATAAADAALAAELAADPKERAEHVMLVDLGRNDVGRVSRPGSVQVTQFMDVEQYSHVMHLVTAVEGRLARGRDALAALAAAFPAGTVSGAPKVRAMEIIEELEPARRGPYAGGVGYLAWNGNLDVCITIRTLLLAGGQVSVQAGAGVVAASVPQREYQETEGKAAALLAAVDMAERGVVAGAAGPDPR